MLNRTLLNSSHLLPADTVPLATEMVLPDEKSSIRHYAGPAASPWLGNYFPAVAGG